MADLLEKNNDPLFKAFLSDACNDLLHGGAEPSAIHTPVKENVQPDAGDMDRDAALNAFAAGADTIKPRVSGIVLPSGRPAVSENNKRDFKEEADKEADSLLTKLLSATK